MAPPDADPARPLGEPWGKPSQRALRGPATRSSRATGPWNALPHARRPTTRAPPQPDPRRAQPAPLSLFFPPSFTHTSGADSTPPGTRPPKSHGGPRGGGHPTNGEAWSRARHGDGGGRGEGADAALGRPSRDGETKAAQNGRWAGGGREGGTRTKRGPESTRAEEGTGSGKGAPTETRARPPGKRARDPTATSTRAVP